MHVDYFYILSFVKSKLDLRIVYLDTLHQNYYRNQQQVLDEGYFLLFKYVKYGYIF